MSDFDERSQAREPSPPDLVSVVTLKSGAACRAISEPRNPAPAMRRLVMNRSVVSREPVCNGVGIFAIYRATIFAINKFNAFVVPGLDAFDKVGAVHDIGFQKNDGALVEAGGEKVAGPEERIVVEIGRKLVIGPIGVGWQIGLFLEGGGDVGGEGEFFIDGAGEEALEHLEAFVVVRDFGFVKGSGENDMEVLSGGECRRARAIKVEADDEVGFDLFVDEVGAGADFGSAVEELGVGEVFRAERGDGFGFGSGERDARAKIFEKWLKVLCGAKSHGALLDGRCVGIVEFALFDFCKFSTDVPGVYRDDEAFEGKIS